MELNFNRFFGYEAAINSAPDLVLIYGFAGIMFGMVALILFSAIFRKIGLQMVSSHFINPLVLALGICLVVAILPTLVLKLVANNISGVKLVYSWIAIFVGISIFTFLNYQMIKNFIYSNNRDKN